MSLHLKKKKKNLYFRYTAITGSSIHSAAFYMLKKKKKLKGSSLTIGQQTLHFKHTVLALTDIIHKLTKPVWVFCFVVLPPNASASTEFSVN